MTWMATGMAMTAIGTATTTGGLGAQKATPAELPGTFYLLSLSFFLPTSSLSIGYYSGTAATGP
jgi:hypothetical protein